MPSLSEVEGWHAPAGRRTCEPRPPVQDGQIRPARRWVPETWARPTNRFAGQPERHQPNRRSGRTQAPDPTPAPTEGWGSRAGSTIHTLPAEYLQPDFRVVAVVKALRLFVKVRGGPPYSGTGSRRIGW